jgi:Spy/CpxP family protein refolding chaperone
MNKKFLISLIAGSSLFIASGLAMAKSSDDQHSNPPPCPREVGFVMGCHGHDFPGMEQLTPDQQKAVKSILESSRAKAAPQFQALQAKNVMLSAQLLQPKIDRNAINQLMQEINVIQGQLLQQRVDTILQIKDKTGVTLPL